MQKHFLGMSKKLFIVAAADLMGDLNVLHPFREGNTRTLQCFMRQLVRNVGFDLDLTKIKPFELRRAGVEAAFGEPTQYRAILADIVSPFEPTQSRREIAAPAKTLPTSPKLEDRGR